MRSQEGKGKRNNYDEIDLSVILPVYNEEKNVGRLVDELVNMLEELNLHYEIIAVNVPGKDDSFRVLRELGDTYEHFYPINAMYLQTKGYQKGYQYMLGFSVAKGKRVVQMDSDYQDDPKDLLAFLEKLNEGYDMVVGWKQDRKDPFFYKLTSKIQNFLTRILTGVDVHDKNCGFKAYERVAVDSLNLYGMNYRDIPLQLSAKGFKVAEIPINNRKRISGKSNFTFLNRLVGGTLDFSAVVLVSMMLDKPFRIWGGIGIVLGFIGISMMVTFAVWVFVTGGSLGLNWWTVLWVVLGVLLSFVSLVSFGIGVVTEYVRSLQRFSIDEYHVIEDRKGVFEE